MTLCHHHLALLDVGFITPNIKATRQT